MAFVNKKMELAFAIMDLQGIIVKILWTYVPTKIVQKMVFVILAMELAFVILDLQEITVKL
jgi:hypothetical protein